MNYIYISILSLFILGCSADRDNETESQKPIDWEEELFGVGLYGIHPDSLNQAWYSFPINENSIEQIEEHPLSRYKCPYKIQGDTLNMYNRFFYHYLDTINWRNRESAINDSSSFIISKEDSSTFKLIKINGHILVPEILFIQLSSSKLDSSFQHLDVRTSFARAPSDIRLSVYQDTSFLIMKCFKCDSLPRRSIAQLNKEETAFVNRFINTLIEKRKEGRRANTVCTLGYSHDLVLVHDNLIYTYDNYTVIPILPDILHEYLSNTIDISRFSPFPEDMYNTDYLYINERYRKYIHFEKGNDLVDTATVQMIEELPEPKRIIPPPPFEHDEIEATFDTVINIK
jgi:hypothetical protein